MKQSELPLRFGGRAADGWAPAASELVVLERVENGARARNHRRGHAGEPRHLNAVAAIGSARHDLVQEDDLVLPLARRDVRVYDARQRVGQIGELVIVRREQRLGPAARVRRQIFGDRPRNAQTIEGGGAASDFIEHHQAARGGAMENVRGLLHLHHECGLAAHDVVGRPHARVNAIHQGQLRAARRHERSRLCHQADQRRLAQVRRFAAHVRAGQNHELAGVGIERHVVWHKGAVAPALQHRVAAVGDDQLVGVVNVRLDVVGQCRRFGEAGKRVERGQRPRRFLDGGGFGRHARAHLLEELDFALQDALVGAKHFFFVFLQRGRDEALAAGDGLLPEVVRRHRVEIRFRDLDVVAKHAVVAHFQR